LRTLADAPQTGETRRAVAVLWDPALDARSGHPPCLVALKARRRAGRLHLVAYLRSSDVHRAWPLNALALRRLQARLAALVGGVALGDLVTVAGSAHVYEECWPAVSALLRARAPELDRVPRFVRDPRGSFALRLEDGAIVVEHYTPTRELLATHRGRTAEELRHRLAPLRAPSRHPPSLRAHVQTAALAPPPRRPHA